MTRYQIDRDGQRLCVDAAPGEAIPLNPGDLLVLASAEPSPVPVQDGHGNPMKVHVDVEASNATGPKILYTITEENGRRHTYLAEPEHARAVARRVLAILGEGP